SFHQEDFRESSSVNRFTLYNEKYHAELTKPKGKEGFVLTEWKLEKEKPDFRPGMVTQKLPWLWCGNQLLHDWIADPSFVITRTERLAGGGTAALVRVHFTCDKSRRKSEGVPDHIPSGHIDFDPSHSYCVMRYEYRYVTKVSEGTERGILEYASLDP